MDREGSVDWGWAKRKRTSQHVGRLLMGGRASFFFRSRFRPQSVGSQLKDLLYISFFNTSFLLRGQNFKKHSSFEFAESLLLWGWLRVNGACHWDWFWSHDISADLLFYFLNSATTTAWAGWQSAYFRMTFLGPKKNWCFGPSMCQVRKRSLASAYRTK